MQITEEHLRIYFGRNSEYYIEKWNDYKNGKIVSFKPYAFLSGLLWFLYRKMYREVLLIFMVLFLEEMLEEFLLTDILEIHKDNRRFMDFIGTIVLAVFCGTFGNYFYMKSSERKIKQIFSKELSEGELINALEKKGGTSWMFLILIAVIIVAIIVINNFSLENSSF